MKISKFRVLLAVVLLCVVSPGSFDAAAGPAGRVRRSDPIRPVRAASLQPKNALPKAAPAAPAAPDPADVPQDSLGDPARPKTPVQAEALPVETPTAARPCAPCAPCKPVCATRCAPRRGLFQRIAACRPVACASKCGRRPLLCRR